MNMKSILSLALSLVLCLALCACSGSSEIDYAYEKMASAFEDANTLSAVEVFAESRTVVTYEQSSTKRYTIESSQTSDVAYRIDENGKILEMLGDYTTDESGKAETYGIYYDGEFVYYADKDANRYEKRTSEISSLPGGDFFLCFDEGEVEGYRAFDEDGEIVCVFTVPWESASPIAEKTYAAVADAIAGSGVLYSDVVYEDMSARVRLDKESGALIGYTYTYTATMTVNGKNAVVEGESECLIRTRENVEITPPDLSLYDE